jgi:hypothetical protein
LESQLWVLAFAFALPAGFFTGDRAIRRLADSYETLVCIAVGVWLITASMALIKISGPSPICYATGSLLCALVVALPWLPSRRTRVRAVNLVSLSLIGGLLTLSSLFLLEAQFNAETIVPSIAVASVGLLAIATVNLDDRRLRRGLDLTILVLLAAVVAQFPPLPDLIEGSQNYFLGPVNDVAHGRAMLDGAWSQYGVGVFYALRAWFWVVPIGYGGLALLLVATTVAIAMLFYGTLRIAGVGLPLAAASLAVVVVGQTFAQVLSYVVFPSVGALRFGLPLAIVFVAVAAERWPRLSVNPRWLQLGLVALAAAWSLEALVYCSATYLSVCLVFGLSSGRRWMRRLARDIVAVLVVSIASIAVVSALTASFSGGLDWTPYLDFLRLYSADGFGQLPVAWFAPGAVAGGMIFASAVGLVWLAWEEPGYLKAPMRAALAGLTGAAVVEFTYFLGRSDLNNLRHVMIPVVGVATLWIAVFLGRGREQSRRSLLASFAIILLGALTVVQGWPFVESKWQDTALALVTPGGTGSLRNAITLYWEEPVVDGRAPGASALLDERTPKGKPVAVILPPDLQTETLVRAGRRNLLAMGHPSEDDLVGSLRARAVGSVNSIEPGDFLLTTSQAAVGDYAGLLPAQVAALAAIKRRFVIQPIATAVGEIVLFSLTVRR